MKGLIGLGLVLVAMAACSGDDGGGGAAGAAGAAGEAGAAGGAQGGESGAGGGATESLAAIQADIFDKSCSFSSCHSAQGKRGNLALGKSGEVPSSAVHKAMVGVPAEIDAKLVLVKPGDAAGSFLIAKLRANGTDFSGTSCDASVNTCGDSMPQASDPLSDAKIQRIERWINQGALDN